MRKQLEQLRKGQLVKKSKRKSGDSTTNMNSTERTAGSSNASGNEANEATATATMTNGMAAPAGGLLPDPHTVDVDDLMNELFERNERHTKSYYMEDEEGGGESGGASQRGMDKSASTTVVRHVEKALNEDIYGVWFTAPYCSVAFYYSTLTLGCQWGIFVFMLADLVNIFSQQEDMYDRLNIPAGKSPVVLFAQVIAAGPIMMLDVFDKDLMRGCSQLIRGYDANITQVSPHATHFKWFMSSILQVFVGILYVSASLILLLQVDSVQEMVFNFAAIEFLSLLDDMAFEFGRSGLVTSSLQEACNHVSNLRFTTTESHVKQYNLIRRVLLLMVTAACFCFFGFVSHKQLNGDLVCSTLLVQFGDDINPDWGYYSSTFVGINNPPYRMEYVDAAEDAIKLSYCNAETAWTFSYQKDNDPCKWFIKSSATNTYDVTEVAGQTWWAKSEQTTQQVVPADWLSLACAECDPELCQGQCDEVTNTCVCDGQRTGWNCEFEESCSLLSLDQRTRGAMSPIVGAEVFTSAEYIRTDHRVYGYPWYVARAQTIENQNKTIQNFDDQILDMNAKIGSSIGFFGRRWVVYDTGNLTWGAWYGMIGTEAAAASPVKSLRFLYKNFGGRPIFFSTPINYGTSAYFRGASASTVKWVLAEPDPNSMLGYRPDDGFPIPAKFLCSSCYQEGVGMCQNGGVCDMESGHCNCGGTFGGHQCEYALSCREIGCPDGNICDVFEGVCRNAEGRAVGGSNGDADRSTTATTPLNINGLAESYAGREFPRDP